jgi:hypothetical protein
MSVMIGGPLPNQIIRPGNLTVTGTAAGRSGPEPVAIQSVTVNGTAATLTRSPGSLTVGFTATVRMPAWVPTSTITATAVDDLGSRTAASVTVRMGGGWVGSWSELYSDNDYLFMLDVAPNADGRLEVVGTNGQGGGTVWYTWQTQPGAAWVGSWSELYTDNDILDMPAVARNADGRLEVFGVPSQGTVWHTWQTQPGGAWVGSWSELYDNDALVLPWIKVAANADGRLEVFGAGGDDHIWHSWQTQPGGAWVGSWSELYTNDALALFYIKVAANADGRLEVFGAGNDSHIWHTAQTQPGSWDGGTWSMVPGNQPAGGNYDGFRVASNADGRLELFVTADDTYIWHSLQAKPGSWDGGWSQLPAITDDVFGTVSVVSFAVAQNGDGRLELVAYAPPGNAGNNQIWHIRQTEPGTWEGATWNKFYSDNDRVQFLYMGRNADGRLEVFGINPDRPVWGAGSIWHTWRDWDVPFEGTPTGTVPSVIGLSPDQSSAEIQAAGFAYAPTTHPVQGTLTPYVESQIPGGGTTAPLGSTVNVTIAVPVTGTVPDVLNLSPGAASAKIQAAGFTYSGSAEPVEGNFKPYVESQDPDAGTNAPLGSTVNVTIAVPVKGPG